MIVIYGHERCIWCKKAKKLAEQYELPFEYRDTDKDENINQLKIDLPEARSVPQIWWNGKHIGGYEDFATEIENTRNFGQDRF